MKLLNRYLKKRPSGRYLLLVVLLSLLPFVFIFSTSKFFYTQDGWTHLVRGAAFYKSLMDGQIPVRWAGDLNYSYGMPLFVFVFQVPYILMSILIGLGLSLVMSLKIITLLSFIGSGIFMYLFAKEFFEDERKAFLVTIFYQFFPFRFSDMMVRGSVGEMYTFTFLPLLLYGIVSISKKSYAKGIVITAVSTAAIALSHLASGAAFIAIAGLFAIIFSSKIKSAAVSIGSIILGLGVSAYYLIPAVTESKYTLGAFYAKNLYAENFVPFVNFFIPNFLNSPSLRTGNVPIQIGLFHTLAILAAVYVLIKAKVAVRDKKIILFCFVIIAVSLFIMQPVSKIIWDKVPLFDEFQFPWRFLGSFGFATSLLSVYLLNFTKKQFIYGTLIVLTVVTTAFYWYPQLGFRKVNEKDYWNYPLTTTYFGETDLVWSAGPAKSYPKTRVEVIGGKGSVSSLKEKSNLHTYNINSSTDVNIVDHTQFYPGWRVYVDGINTPIQFQDANNRGEITYKVAPGQHNIVVKFSDTTPRKIADRITIIAGLLVLGVLLFRKRVERIIHV